MPFEQAESERESEKKKNVTSEKRYMTDNEFKSEMNWYDVIMKSYDE